jgi:hypothetical protein
MLACAMFDTHITLYNNLSQSKICDLDHTDRVQIEADKKKGTVVFEEKLSREQTSMPGMLHYRYENMTSL